MPLCVCVCVCVCMVGGGAELGSFIIKFKESS